MSTNNEMITRLNRGKVVVVDETQPAYTIRVDVSDKATIILEKTEGDLCECHKYVHNGAPCYDIAANRNMVIAVVYTDVSEKRAPLQMIEMIKYDRDGRVTDKHRTAVKNMSFTEIIDCLTTMGFNAFDYYDPRTIKTVNSINELIHWVDTWADLA